MRALEVGEKPIEGWVYRYVLIPKDSKGSEPDYDMTAVCSKDNDSQDGYYRFDIMFPNKGTKDWDLDYFTHDIYEKSAVNRVTLYELGSSEDYPEYFI